MKLMFTRLAKRSRVCRLHAHLCRHTFATRFLINGGDVFTLQQILGHSTLDMVNHYLHFTSSQITAQHHKYSLMDKLQSEVEILPYVVVKVDGIEEIAKQPLTGRRYKKRDKSHPQTA